MILYTIWYSTINYDNFLNTLKLNGINFLVDVRSYPEKVSKIKWFNREIFKWSKLKKALVQDGIGYKFLWDKLWWDVFDTNDWLKTAKLLISKNNIWEIISFYEKYFENNKDKILNWLRELYLLQKKYKVIIMCSEENPYICHRRNLIVKKLNDLLKWKEDFKVYHIRTYQKPKFSFKIEEDNLVFKEQNILFTV